jgi:hypothetical protein
VIPKTEQIRRQLEWPVSIRSSHKKLIDVVQTIGREVGVTVRTEPGVISALPLQTRENFSLYVENKTALEAIELVAATAGLGYRVDPDAVVFYHPGATADQTRLKADRPRAGSNAYVGKIALPPGPDGAQVEIFIRESDLSPETNRLRQKYIQRADQAIREALQRLEEPVGP